MCFYASDRLFLIGPFWVPFYRLWSLIAFRYLPLRTFVHRMGHLPSNEKRSIALTTNVLDSANKEKIMLMQIPADPDKWSLTSSWGPSSYVNSTVTLLVNGNVLVAGGSGDASKAARLYDPTTDTWTDTGSLNNLHPFDPTATLIKENQKVLLVGGRTAELYDPSTGTWTLTGSLTMSRDDHTATSLPGGRVLVVGGSGNAATTAELYDPTTNTWAATGSLTTPRRNHAAVYASNGGVLVTGGNDAGTAVELYDPTAGTWTTVAPMSTPRSHHTMTSINPLGGKVLVAGGDATGTAAELYDPTTGTWTTAAPMNTTHLNHTAVLLPSSPNGQVFVLGGGITGSETAVAEFYNQVADTWTTVNAMMTPRANHAATLLQDNRILVVGGTGINKTIGSTTTIEAKLSAEYYIPFPFQNNAVITLQADNTLYLRPGNHPTPSGDWFPIEASASSADPLSRYTVRILPNKQITLQTGSLPYLTRGHPASQGDYIEASASSVDPSCQFTVKVLQPNQIVLQADNGLFWARVVIDVQQSIQAAKSSVDPSCQFTLTVLS